MKLAIVSASTDPVRAADCIHSWEDQAIGAVPIIIIVNGREWTPKDAVSTLLQAHWVTSPQYLGTVPAFKLGVDYALDHTDADIICALHDDFRIDESRWDEKVLKHFERHPLCGLAGFGGAIGLGDADIYQKTYDPMQLARIGFRSNLVEAEKHGIRSLLPEQVACLDGFSQVGRREFWDGYGSYPNGPWPEQPHYYNREGLLRYRVEDRPWDVLQSLGMVHHWYDGALGCLAKRYGWETWYLPLRGHHFGGRTAVGDKGYGDWAKTQVEEGDQGFWRKAHEIGYAAFKDILPLRV